MAPYGIQQGLPSSLLDMFVSLGLNPALSSLSEESLARRIVIGRNRKAVWSLVNKEQRLLSIQIYLFNCSV